MLVIAGSGDAAEVLGTLTADNLVEGLGMGRSGSGPPTMGWSLKPSRASQLSEVLPLALVAAL